MSEGGQSTDHGGQGLSLARLAAIISAASSATLGVLKLTGGTMSGAIAMGSQLITGLAQATAAGHAVRYEAQGPGTLPTTALFPTEVTATAHTRVAYTDGDQGTCLVVSSASASTRISGALGPGSRVAVLHESSVHQTGAATELAHPGGVITTRADGVILFLGSANTVAVGLFRFTDKDTYSGVALVAGYGRTSSPPRGYRLGDSAGNVVAEVSMDGVNWTQIYSGTPTAAYGSPGATTSVAGDAVMAVNATSTMHKTSSRVTVTP